MVKRGSNKLSIAIQDSRSLRFVELSPESKYVMLVGHNNSDGLAGTRFPKELKKMVIALINVEDVDNMRFLPISLLEKYLKTIISWKKKHKDEREIVDLDRPREGRTHTWDRYNNHASEIGELYGARFQETQQTPSPLTNRPGTVPSSSCISNIYSSSSSNRDRVNLPSRVIQRILRRWNEGDEGRNRLLTTENIIQAAYRLRGRGLPIESMNDNSLENQLLSELNSFNYPENTAVDPASGDSLTIENMRDAVRTLDNVGGSIDQQVRDTLMRGVFTPNPQGQNEEPSLPHSSELEERSVSERPSQPQRQQSQARQRTPSSRQILRDPPYPPAASVRPSSEVEIPF